MVIGHPVGHSLSPVIHPAGFKALGIEGQYSYKRVEVTPSELEKFVKKFRKNNYLCSSITAPHKVKLIKYLDEIDGIAKEIGAVNSIINKKGVLKGYNFDWVGAVEPLQEKTSLKNKVIVVLGAGGVAKAFVYGLTKAGANVTIINRTDVKAKTLASKFDCSYKTFSELDFIKTAEIICNATSAGLGSGNSFVPRNYFNSNQIVFDASYKPLKSQFLLDAESRGAKTINGIEMLLHQGYAQFKLFTGLDAPRVAMRKAVMEHIDG